LAEELNFTRGAQTLRIGQPALSKQITEVEGLHRLLLFTRKKGCQPSKALATTGLVSAGGRNW